jgi:adenylate cyclase
MQQSMEGLSTQDFPSDPLPNLILGFIVGTLSGLVLGLLEFFLEKKFFRKKPLGIILVMRLIATQLTLMLLFALIRFVFFEKVIVPTLYNGRSPLTGQSWQYIFIMFLLYYLFMTLVISTWIQMNKKYGPGVLLPLLLGKYRNPKVEERIFLFMDLRSSAMIAEKLGHIRYSRFISESFMDINQLLKTYQAEIYQYVGDEIVINWRLEDGLKNMVCIRFYFACMELFTQREEYYMKQYGILPFFKGGMHMGPVTVVEVGEIKRDIAYHGDTINTASRIQDLCNKYKSSLLISGLLAAQKDVRNLFAVTPLGRIKLKGKLYSIEIASVDSIIRQV